MTVHHHKRGWLAEQWSALSARERNYIRILGLVVIVMAVAFLFYKRGTSFSDMRKDIAQLRRGIHLVNTQGAVYREKLRQKEEREATISADPLLFSTLLEQAANKVEGVSAANEETPPAVELGSGLRKSSVEFHLKNVTLAQLTDFLATVEAKPGHIVFTDYLRITSASDEDDRLNARVTVSTWQRVVEGPAAGEEAP